MLTIGSCFSGIGGLELGLERVGFGPVKWQVENDPDAQKILREHWPYAELFGDIRELALAPKWLQPVELICGGFPCQDISPAGSRKGLKGARSGLWSSMRVLIASKRPRFVVVENNANQWRRWVPTVRRELGALGFRSVPVVLRASDLGALHERARCFVIAEASSDTDGAWKQKYRRVLEEVGGWVIDRGRWPAEPAMARVVHGVRGRARVERLLGNAVSPIVAQAVGEIVRRCL